MKKPGFEPGLLRPQRSVLTRGRSRLTILSTASRGKKTSSLTLIGAPRILKLELYFLLRMPSKMISLADVSENSWLYLQNISKLTFFV